MINATTTLTTCSRHGLTFSAPRRHFQWGEAECIKCRALARKAAHKARRRDPLGVGFLRALYRTFETRPFLVEHAEPIAMGFGLDRVRLERFLAEVGPGTFDPTTGEGEVGDGILTVHEGPLARGLAVYAFDGECFGGLAKQSVAGPPPAATLPAAPPYGVAPPAARPLPGTPSSATSPRRFPGANAILDRISERRNSPTSVLGPVDVARLIGDVAPDLDAAAARGEMLLRVSVTMPKWNWQGARGAGAMFRDHLLALGASGVLLALDRRKDGAPHWYGVATLPSDQGAKVVRALVQRAWIAASGAASDCIRIHCVTGWAAFTASGGNLDATIGKHSFRTNLARVLAYAFKAWPQGFGGRRHRDVLEEGIFGGATRACSRRAPQDVAAIFGGTCRNMLQESGAQGARLAVAA